MKHPPLKIQLKTADKRENVKKAAADWPPLLRSAVNKFEVLQQPSTKIFGLILTQDSAHGNCQNSIKFHSIFCKINNSSEKFKKREKIKKLMIADRRRWC